MVDLNALNRYRQWETERKLYGENGDSERGVFAVKVRGVKLHIIATSGMGWDHVSVSTKRRCPTWEEMSAIKLLFFRDNETAMELHVPPNAHINNHPYCLHLWRPHDQAIPIPPSIMVGVK